MYLLSSKTGVWKLTERCKTGSTAIVRRCTSSPHECYQLVFWISLPGFSEVQISYLWQFFFIILILLGCFAGKLKTDLLCTYFVVAARLEYNVWTYVVAWQTYAVFWAQENFVLCILRKLIMNAGQRYGMGISSNSRVVIGLVRPLNFRNICCIHRQRCCIMSIPYNEISI